MKLVFGLIALWATIIGLSVAGYLTNIVELVQRHTALGDLAFGLAGIAIPPVGVVHGIGHWFGVW